MATVTIPGSGTTGPPSGNGISYDGQAGPVFRLGLKVAALTLVTLGIYRFWGKTEIRRHLWSRLRLGADRFEYTGTGKELFLGFLIVLALLVPLGIVFQTLGVLSVAWSPTMQTLVSVLQTLVFLYLIGYAIYRARRYRLSRTLLRGIRFGQAGSAARYGLMFVAFMLLSAATLGIAKPMADVELYRFQIRHTRFGDRQFDFDGAAGQIVGGWIACLLLVPFTLGLSLLWYAAFKVRYLTGGTRFMTTGFALPMRFWDMFRIYAPYFLVLLLLLGGFAGVVFENVASEMSRAAATGEPIQPVGTLTEILTVAVFFLLFGILAPVLRLVLVTHRLLKFVAANLVAVGEIGFDEIVQSARERSGAAEGMADALDVGAGVEVGF